MIKINTDFYINKPKKIIEPIKVKAKVQNILQSSDFKNYIDSKLKNIRED